MLEVYQAYSDFRGMMELLKAIFADLCATSSVRPRSSTRQRPADQLRRRVARGALFRPDDEAVGFKLSALRSAPDYKAKATEARAETRSRNHPGWQTHEIVNEIFGKKIEPTLIQPTFVTHLPRNSRRWPSSTPRTRR